MKPGNQTPTRWLLLGDNLIGDSLLQTPAIRQRKLDHPDDELHYICGNSRGTQAFFLDNPYLDTVTVVENGVDEFPGTAIAAELGPEYDRVVPMDAWKAFQWGVAHQRTLAEGYGSLLEADVRDLRYDLVLPDEELARGRALAETLGGGQPVVVVARHSASCASNDPKAGYVPNKCVANREWLKTAQWLKDQGYVPVAVGAAGDRADDRYKEWDGSLAYGEPYGVLGGLLQASAAVLSVDTGIRHMAAALGANLYCLSGAIRLELIRCVPVREGQQVMEEFRPLIYATARALTAGARRVLKGTTR